MLIALTLRRSPFIRTQFSLKFARRLHVISISPFRPVLQPSLLARHIPNAIFTVPRIITRTQSTIDVKYTAADLDINEYHKMSDKTMERIVEYFEALGDDIDMAGFDVEYAQGVLTLKLGSGEIYLLNKQPPNKQIWLSSPMSGPKRYDYDAKHGKWFYYRDQSTIDELLDTELSKLLVKEVKILKS